MHTLSDYNYPLPPHLIAQNPAEPPESCKFLVYNKTNGSLQDQVFSDITTLIDPDTLIIFNNSKVLKARLTFSPSASSKQTMSPPDKGVDVAKGNEATSGGGLQHTHEIFYLNSLDQSPYTFNALVRPGKKFKVGSTVHLNDEVSFHVDALTHDGRQLTCNKPIFEILDTYGKMPLPPYISYDDTKADPYQPVFASQEGSVAAPTASLHFTKKLIQQLESQGIQTAYTTLHVGLGTFKQVDQEDIKSYDIHAETIHIDLSLFGRIAKHKAAGKPTLAVGTTVTRTLESLPYLWKMLSNKQSDGLPGQGKVDLAKPKTEGFAQQEKMGILITSRDQQTITYRDQLTQNITTDQAHQVISTLTCLSSSKEGARGSCSFSSKLFLYPGKPFYVIDQLITNFHLPKSSLLMLVAGLIGYKNMKKIYRYAIDQEYRFYSFGDAMWVK